MPTNEQRRETAKRKLERQLERRAERARKQRIWTISGVAIVAVVLTVAVTLWLTLGSKDKSDSSATASADTSAPLTSDAPAPPDPDLAGTPKLPAFKAPAGLGQNCQYTPEGEASKKVELPRSGLVPTTPDKVSVSMKTNQGNIGIQLANNESPCTVNSFASLAQKGFFDKTPCHRLSTKGLGMLQCGDPTGSGTGGPGYVFANEYPTDQYPPNDPALQEPVIYPRGTLAMANTGQPNSNGSQFFMIFKDSKLPPQYTVFGTIDKTGLATLDKIAQAGDDGSLDSGPGGGKPKLPVTIEDVQLD